MKININFVTTFLRRHIWIIALVTVTIVLCAIIAKWTIWPAYQDPVSRMFVSKLGYATVLRKQGKPFPVKSGVVQSRLMTSQFLGEGIMRSEPIQVPIVAMSRIVRVHAQQGDVVKKGQLLVELDPSRLKIKIESAMTQIRTAKAEYERTKIGSAYILEKERPERDQIRLDAAKSEVGIRSELDELYDSLVVKGFMSKEEALLKRIESRQVQAKLKEARLSIKVAENGRQQSLEIAAAAIREAELALAYRNNELLDYKVYAPADGIIERCVIHEGEYNQDPGKPAFVISSGLWFEAYLDQSAIGQFQVGEKAEVHLEAFPGQTFDESVNQILPMVSYSLGGPETNRPIRPLGTGAPEWPATFPVRIYLEADNDSVAPGLTGFVRISSKKTANAVPRGAVVSISGKKALVFVINGDTFHPVEVTVGCTADGWTEITSGLELGTEVITDGHQVLEPDDKITVKEHFSDPITNPSLAPPLGEKDQGL